jgi:hypothetical protein
VGELKNNKIVSFNRLNKERRAALDNLCSAFEEQTSKDGADKALLQAGYIDIKEKGLIQEPKNST